MRACVCVKIKARPVLTPCASLGKIKPSWGQGQWRGGTSVRACRSERKGAERECGGALKRRERPANTFYSLCVYVSVWILSKMGSVAVVFWSETVMWFASVRSSGLMFCFLQTFTRALTWNSVTEGSARTVFGGEMTETKLKGNYLLDR